MTRANTTPKPHSGPVRACPVKRRPPFDAAGAAAAAAARLPRPMPVAVRENARAKNVVLRLIPGQGLVITAPVGLPRELARADGTLADAPDPEAARLMQEVTASVVDKLGVSGISA